MHNKDIAVKIIELIGGSSNIIETHTCMTRLHVKINDISQVNEKAIKEMEEVFGPGKVTKIGEEVNKILSESKKEIDLESRGKEEKSRRQASQTKPIQVFFKRFANIFLPLLPGIAGAGLIND